MSTWTHVTGTIRIDGIAGFSPMPNYGNACDGMDEDAVWEACDVPCGSEGSLTINAWQNPNDCSASRYAVNIFGDLRDYTNEQEIIDYFSRIVDGHEVRQGVFTIMGGDLDGIRTYVYSNNEWVKLNIEGMK